MARTSALGAFLKKSKGKGKEHQRQNSGAATQQRRAALERELLIWRIRGGLWIVTLSSVLCFYASGGCFYISARAIAQDILPCSQYRLHTTKIPSMVL